MLAVTTRSLYLYLVLNTTTTIDEPNRLNSIRCYTRTNTHSRIVSMNLLNCYNPITFKHTVVYVQTYNNRYGKTHIPNQQSNLGPCRYHEIFTAMVIRW